MGLRLARLDVCHLVCLVHYYYYYYYYVNEASVACDGRRARAPTTQQSVSARWKVTVRRCGDAVAAAAVAAPWGVGVMAGSTARWYEKSD